MTISLKTALAQMIGEEIKSQCTAEALVERIFSIQPVKIPGLKELRYRVRKHPEGDEGMVITPCPGTLIESEAWLEGGGPLQFPQGIVGKVVTVWLDLEGHPLDQCCYCGSKDIAPSIRSVRETEREPIIPKVSPLPSPDADPLQKVVTDIAMRHLIGSTAAHTMQLIEIIQIAARNEWRDDRGRPWGWDLAVKSIEEALQAARAFKEEALMMGKFGRISRQKGIRDLYLEILKEATLETGGN